MPGTATQTDVRGALLARLADARVRTDALFRLLRAEAVRERPIPERHRLIFYLGHLEAFDWNLLGRRTLGLQSFHPDFDRLFAFGIDPVGGGLPDDRPGDWPGVEEIAAYNRRARETLDAALLGADWSDPDYAFLGDGTVVEAAVEHRLMHAETLAYLLHQLPLEQKVPLATPPAAPVAFAPCRVPIPAGVATLGKPRENGFGWDNEFDLHTVEVPAFALDAYPVTNGRYLEFVRAGGYRERGFWSDEDWDWKEKHGVEHPRYWLRRGEEWRWRGMFAEPPLPLEAPVYVSHAEASAYARWAGGALPSEAQWHRAAYGTPGGRERSYPWGEAEPSCEHGNFEFRHWDPTPAAAYPAGASAFGVHDLLGNGWEWTSTVFEPFAGFEPYPFYPGYSANFFHGRHFVMKGGSPRTAASMLRRSFRNWFQPHYPYVYAKFRLVEG